MNEELIAPCGMNCGICGMYLALQHDVKGKGIRMPYCPGCRPRDKRCAYIRRSCALLQNDSIKYCHQCKAFPCAHLQTLDKRYRTRYHMSMVDNLNFIKRRGIAKFLAAERRKWKCPKCGGVLCCHNGLCFNCNLEKLKTKKNKYRWSTTTSWWRKRAHKVNNFDVCVKK